jgi:hypothetical protein
VPQHRSVIAQRYKRSYEGALQDLARLDLELPLADAPRNQGSTFDRFRPIGTSWV